MCLCVCVCARALFCQIQCKDKNLFHLVTPCEETILSPVTAVTVITWLLGILLKIFVVTYRLHGRVYFPLKLSSVLVIYKKLTNDNAACLRQKY